MAVGAGLAAETPLPFQKYDVTSDGKYFVVVEPVDDGPPRSIHLVENWFEEFRGGE